MAEIPFWFHDRPKWVSGIGRNTTCADVLHSLLRSHAAKNNPGLPAEEIRRTARQLVLVEQWRGVERPLGGTSRILKLWQAWGEERSQVKFIVKRMSTSSSQANSTNNLQPSSSLAASTAATAASSTYSSLSRSRRARRRNSRMNSASSSARARSQEHLSGGETLHPSALVRASSSSLLSNSGDIERLMRIILTQGETIHAQLKRLQEREGQIGAIEEEVHVSRTRTAGKDYLLKAYLNNSNSSNNEAAATTSEEESKTKSLKRRPKKSDSKTPECLREMVEALQGVSEINDKLERAEETIGDLNLRMGQNKPKNVVENGTIEWTQNEVTRLKELNDKVGREIDLNRRMISDLGQAFQERKCLVGRLEADVGHVELEGQRLEAELRRVKSEAVYDPVTDLSVCEENLNEPESPPQHMQELRLPPLVFPPEDEDEEDLMRDIFGSEQRYRLSNSQLYENHPQYQPMLAPNSQREAYFAEQFHKFGIRTRDTSLPPDTVARISATGSPGSNSSSSGCGTASASSSSSNNDASEVPRSAINATPDLPPLPPGEYLPPPPPASHLTGARTKRQQVHQQQNARTQHVKHMLKSADPSGDLDSNSDTGLSSLHSSSDEGTYVLDTLV